MNATHMVLADADLSSKEAKEMLQEMSDVKGVKFALDLIVFSVLPSRAI